MDSFATRLNSRIRQLANPVCVGLDPRLDQLPVAFTQALNREDHSQVAEAYAAFCREIIDVVAGMVPVVKPQMAFFEALGPAGMVALASVIQHASEAGLIVLLDGKRNDIGSTAEAYAQAYLQPRPSGAWGADALTISPYLGADSLEPFAQAARQWQAGLFVLVKTSNPGSGQLQNLTADGRPVFSHVAGWLDELESLDDGTEYGSIGAVAGATHPNELATIREMLAQRILLVPGYGAQGAGAAEVSAAFDDHGLGAIINSSRAIIFAHRRPEFRDRFGEGQWQQAVEAATQAMIDELRAETTVGRLHQH